VGFLLLDSSYNPIYFNDDAVQILAYPNDSREIKFLDRFLAKKSRSELFNGQPTPQSPPCAEFLSGRRRYCCRAFTVASQLTTPSDATAVLFERRPGGPIDFAQIAAKFHLTGREQETVGFLLEGLTSKEIAERMRISPNTVKTFIRLVMIKVGVYTRSGVIGKMVTTLP
jgi:DNA-binding CsgD family transcriptional regulator